MDFKLHSHRHAEAIMRASSTAKPLLDDLLGVISGITDDDLKKFFTAKTTKQRAGSGKVDKSLSIAVNGLLKTRLAAKGWATESPIFKGAEYGDEKVKGDKTKKNSKNPWRLDFAKADISVEVAFNHGEAIPWNLLKPVIAGELNHVDKAIQSEFGVVICATEAMKKAGNFDGAVGEYEKILKYLKPLRNFLTVPLLIVGLEAPKTFRIDPDRRVVVPIR
jgi:hypothetical protein